MIDAKRCWVKTLSVATACGALLLGAASGAQAQKMGGAMDEMAKTSDTRAMSMRDQNADMLIKTLSEEKTEINQLAAQSAMMKKMGGSRNMRIARMFDRWVREHKAKGPTLMRLIRQNGGDPMAAKIMKPPVLGDEMKMLHATMVDHMKAEMTSQMRHGMTRSPAIKAAMKGRAILSRRHMREMQRYHSEKNCPACAQMMKDMKGGMKMHGASGMNHNHGGMSATKAAAMCPHCNVKMQGGKCPMCGMTAAQMKKG